MPLIAAGTSTLRVRYPDGHGILRQVLNGTTQRGFTIDDLSTEPTGDAARWFDAGTSGGKSAVAAVTMHVPGKRPFSELAGALADLDLVGVVVAGDGQGAETGEQPTAGTDSAGLAAGRLRRRDGARAGSVSCPRPTCHGPAG